MGLSGPTIEGLQVSCEMMSSSEVVGVAKVANN